MKPIVSGIYLIRNKITKKNYIGSSNNIKRRWRHHRSLLKNNKHHSKSLQNSYNKYGKDAFEFVILKEVEQKDLLIEEQKFFFVYDCLAPKGYNISEVAGSPFAKKKHTEEARRNQSEKNAGPNNPWYGKTLTEQHNRNISKAKKRFSDEEEKQFYLRYCNGETKNSIARSIGVHPTTIHRAIERYVRFREAYDRE